MKRESSHIEIITSSAQQTKEIACLIGGKLKKGDILALSGELGSGKTCFVSGLARGLGIGEEYKITSPTFTLINEYPGRCNLYHFDVYRLSGCAEFEELGYEEYFWGDGIVAIEWAEKIAPILPPSIFSIQFDYIDENRRKIRINGLAGRVKELARDLGTEVG
ncbi:MAG TPA: tRNA (adenosine(37)-N6)-threonylcarbamoyltransferase complex ATPase subunit type 1 TsaE [Smithellaceae bacterium]|jgi:tRNA threonylcarbamoyladenosine biosynthesis protein TsaE|nr:tRNA (adenosine(37)-N6)-threonylcarbamoyltransferase complex ATPase subunit type 1 TsaE [Syntrophaceae bacterium]OPZ52514.1 MAG: tRNA threonylcarbamoyladenosine biosynthesis protein TsaE [Deltaproteobacteria bacterium ADurb.BinA014]HNQ18558.1 tRNA (adenosine(37)-N6)-threonylcarbamoyltransferase complex ATPase subunit type 1 TsaE [Smithellaceae bacterium]MBP8609296.1 tRNA (adenosine(37)-N6)-threonylcarbamoyltransferase complex ATPase subunit type 1 TsaE [Syntrophaceae bacterium]HNT91068.1 tRN